MANMGSGPGVREKIEEISEDVLSILNDIENDLQQKVRKIEVIQKKLKKISGKSAKKPRK